MYDVIVAGAGPAGLGTAIRAASAGLHTLVIDPRLGSSDGLIDKACGEGLMPGAVRALRDIGVEPAGHPLRGIRYLRGRYSAQAQFSAGPGAGVRRTELHAAMLRRAVEVGVQLDAVAAGEISQDANLVRVAGNRARYLVAADGLHSPIRRQLGLQKSVSKVRTARYFSATRPAVRENRRWGLRQHFAIAAWTDFVEVHWGNDTELYVTPVSDNLVGIAVLTSRRATFAELLSEFPSIAQRLPAKRVAATDVRGAGPLRQRVHRRVSGRVLLVGDAAGYVDALTGDGIAVGQSCATVLVDCLLADRPADYERQWLTACRSYRVLTTSLLWARQQRRIAPAIVPAAQRAPWLFARAVNQLAK